MSIPNYVCELQDEIVRLRSEVSAQTAIAHEAQAALREAKDDADQWQAAAARRLEDVRVRAARLAAVARMARNLHANGNRVLAEDLMRAIEEQT